MEWSFLLHHLLAYVERLRLNRCAAVALQIVKEAHLETKHSFTVFQGAVKKLVAGSRKSATVIKQFSHQPYGA